MKGKDLYEQGMETARKIWGNDRAQRMEEALADLNPGFQQHVVNALALYSRPGLDQKTRSLCTVAALTVLGYTDELKLHIRGALRSGASQEEIEEVLLQMAAYGGIPASIGAFTTAKRVFEKEKQGGPKDNAA